MRRFAVVTTCHAAGYAQYGRQMLETFERHWPSAVTLHLYTEGFACDVPSPRIVSRDLHASSPELVAFKARHRDDVEANGHVRPPVAWRLFGRRVELPLRRRRRHDYRFDAVRFAHKSFAILHAAQALRDEVDVLLWIDADTRFFADVDAARLESFVPADRFVGCLRRAMMHTECGFVAYNLAHPASAGFLADFGDMYLHDRFRAEREWHDSWLFDVARERAEARGARSYDIAEGTGATASHVLVNCQLGEFMDHMKGDRKRAGRSDARDLVVRRGESYWSGTR
ncbi:hypothetical protein [Coralloluteibacterium stylophorae]|uniref:Nucleotide-diphospho-sugar transferase domain-containing protein n=1 Tax=Coralloluteibacterium stylophorae TaxID=1776034 RepID=A0A8J8B0K4_9GAMM|nr:hypothetical protein [Coralloluteibacterium stylophorae]MBS7458916.1 hypothetical protein [Coralloluteibacterium stylophorae]